MRNTAEERKSPNGTWIQITFTLDPEHYRALWERAEEEHRTIAGFVRERVVAFSSMLSSVTCISGRI